MEKILCNTEDLLLELIFSGFKTKDQRPQQEKKADGKNHKSEEKETITTIRINESDRKNQSASDSPGFKALEDGTRILHGNLSLSNREELEPCHFKSCFFSSLLCVLAKIKLDPGKFRSIHLDQIIFLGDKIYNHTGKLRYKPYRWFHGIRILDTTYNVITKQTTYADPENFQEDDVYTVLENFLEKHQTGVVVFQNAAVAFWISDGKFYLFDSYSCNEQGVSSEAGGCCLMEFEDLTKMLERIKENVSGGVEKPYRVYALFITHMASRKRKKARRKKRKDCIEKIEEETPPMEEPLEADSTTESEESLIETTEWLTTEVHNIHDLGNDVGYNVTIPGFAPMQDYTASILEVSVLEDEITSPRLPPFKRVLGKQSGDEVDSQGIGTMVRRRIPQRSFKEHSALATPLDLCFLSWSLIHDPITWSIRTVKGLFEASVNHALDSLLATEDSTVANMVDGLLPELEIGNYIFQIVFAPLHFAVLYATEGWNLSMSLQKLFETQIYTGAALVCGDAHIGLTKREDSYFCWWLVKGTKKLRIVTSTSLREFLRLLVQEINRPEETLVIIRPITISYARKVDPDCCDVAGLHESVDPATSLPEIHRKEDEPYNLEAMFRSTLPESKPVFILGTVALRNRDGLKEPRMKRCYFVAILVAMVKRDVVQSPVPGMIDRVLQVGEALYREFSEPKFHTEHILRNVTVMNRIFDMRDCASAFVRLTMDRRTGRNDFYVQVKKHLKRFFKTHASGLIHFGNCCYGFWHSRSTNSYYYLDPYQCNARGKKVPTGGAACLCIFPSICQMVKHMCQNQHEGTSGFYLHRLHIDSINVPPYKTFIEDPMWLYLDYHWSYSHNPTTSKPPHEETPASNIQEVRQHWNNYTIEVSNLIYSIWGTIGSYDPRFGDRAGRNQAGICVAISAMRYLSHPSRWGTAILDSAVICGDSYYTESLRSSLQKGARHENKFNLQPCFTIFPHSWGIGFEDSVCGTLYGGRNKVTLADGLKLGFQRSSSLLIECNRCILAALVTEEGFYAADPCWVGPPLFEKDRGAIYTLRCRNLNTLVYALTKMLNTNQRLEFRITPLAFAFEQDDSGFMDGKRVVSPGKRILVDPIRTAPGRAQGSMGGIMGGQVVPDEDSYLRYKRNLGLGIRDGRKLEDPEMESTLPRLERDNERNALVSTVWHLNLGQAEPLKKTRLSMLDEESVEDEECPAEPKDILRSRHSVELSLTQLLATCDDYPRVIDFTGRRLHQDRTTGVHQENRNRDIVSQKLDCTIRTSFITDEARRMYESWNTEIGEDVYKTYKHRLPKSRRDERRDENFDTRADDAGDVEERIQEPGIIEEVPEGLRDDTEEEETDATLEEDSPN